MGKLGWYFNRLRAMSPREVVWRLEQKRLQRQELARFREKQAVTTPLYSGVEGLVDKVLANPDSSRDTETVRAILRLTEDYGPNHGDESIRLLGDSVMRITPPTGMRGSTPPVNGPSNRAIALNTNSATISVMPASTGSLTATASLSGSLPPGMSAALRRCSMTGLTRIHSSGAYHGPHQWRQPSGRFHG